MNSCIFIGNVQHRRFVSKTHKFNYRLFMLYLDLAELDHVFNDYWLWSHKGFNLAAFKRNKYLGDPNESLLNSVKKLMAQQTNTVPDKVCLLTNLAYYGYCFNPISLYFCQQQNQLTHCIAEVTNTPWNEQHAYVLTANAVKPDVYTMHFQKALHVSPFLTMDYEYRLQCKYTPQQIIVNIENWQNDACHFDATLSLQAKPINHRNLAKILLQFPFITGKIITAIHWQALRLWLKRVPIIAHPRRRSDST